MNRSQIEKSEVVLEDQTEEICSEIPERSDFKSKCFEIAERCNFKSKWFDYVEEETDEGDEVESGSCDAKGRLCLINKNHKEMNKFNSKKRRNDVDGGKTAKYGKYSSCLAKNEDLSQTTRSMEHVDKDESLLNANTNLNCFNPKDNSSVKVGKYASYVTKKNYDKDLSQGGVTQATNNSSTKNTTTRSNNITLNETEKCAKYNLCTKYGKYACYVTAVNSDDEEENGNLSAFNSTSVTKDNSLVKCRDMFATHLARDNDYEESDFITVEMEKENNFNSVKIKDNSDVPFMKYGSHTTNIDNQQNVESNIAPVISGDQDLDEILKL